VILFSEPVYEYWLWRQPVDDTADRLKLDSLVKALKWPEADTVKPLKSPVIFHSFDPNEVTETELVKMGLSKYLAHRTITFREKGGRFYTKEEVLKIYGMDTAWYQQASPWMKLPERQERYRSQRTTTKPKQVTPVNINLADSVQLTDVYGIGPSLSRRIRIFRDRLGGFVSMEQLYEVYGLDSAVVSVLKSKFVIEEGFTPRLVRLNAATLEELTRHPYIRRREAQAILSYRLQHGAFHSTEELNRIPVLTPDWIVRIRPYLDIQ